MVNFGWLPWTTANTVYPRLTNSCPGPMPLVFALLAAVGSPAAAVPPESLPGGRLRARVEAHLEARKEALKESLAHYGLIFEVEQQDLEAFMDQVWFHWDGTGFALGTGYGPEVHGGGLLAFLLDHWRPDSRLSTPSVKK